MCHFPNEIFNFYVQEFSGAQCKIKYGDKTTSLAACKVSQTTWSLIKINSSVNPFQSARPTAFSYGTEARAKYQINALAAHSQEAMQIVTTSCSVEPIKMLGWASNQFNVRGSSWNVDYSVSASLDCMVSIQLYILYWRTVAACLR